ncbi:MAG: hypothetical protein ACI9EF_001598 [Pseudohongiellaceae bacterium]|jgi:hypothetical protein
MKKTLAILSLIAASSAATSLQAQTLYGLDGAGGAVFEFSSMPGGPCGAPSPMPPTAWPFIAPPPCFGPMAGPTAPPGPFSFGDIAADRLTDTIYVCDGFIVEQYSDVSPLAGTPAGLPINSFPLPAVLGLPITGMGMDAAGITTGAPTLYVTDGFLIAGFVPSPPGSCAAPLPIVAPFPSPFPMPAGVGLTDVTLDPSTGTLLACDSGGMIHSIGIGGGFGPYGFFPAAVFCGMTPRLEGIAMDLATTPSALGSLPAFYVTDGFMTTYMDITGGPAAPTFYTPMPCNPNPVPVNGLAYASHSVNYGVPPATAALKSFGQSSSPGPTYGVTITGIPAPGFLFLLSSTNIPGPGFFCPPLFAAGNPLLVDIFSPTGSVTPLFAAGPGAVSIPAPIPAGLPLGVELYLQVFIDLSPGLPGGPWMATDAIDTVITAP